MIQYIKLGKVRGASVEINLNLGITPFFRKKHLHDEIIVDIPYAQIIYTTGKWRKRKRVSIRSTANGNKEIGKVTKGSG